MVVIFEKKFGCGEDWFGAGGVFLRYRPWVNPIFAIIAVHARRIYIKHTF